MGSTKNKTPAQREKAQREKGQASSKKRKSDKSEGPAKAEITVALTDEQAAGYLRGKVIMAHGLARHAGVKISTANAYLKRAAESGQVRLVAGHAGHRIYQPSAR